MKKGGFTLIEVLVVTAIIGLLAVAGVVSYTSLNRSSRDSRRKADLEEIRAAFEQWRSDYGSYPTSLTVNCAAGGLVSGANTYLAQIPKDPQCFNNSYYAQISAGDYTLGAGLEIRDVACSGNFSCGAVTCNYCVGPYGVKP